MPHTQRKKLTRIRITALIVGVVSLLAIVMLAISVVREVTRMNENAAESSDWSLSQTEVEFLEFTNLLAGDDTNLDALALRYDIFYSRVRTIAGATAYSALREEPDFMAHLIEINDFLDQTVKWFDGPETMLRANLDRLQIHAADIRQDVRQLSIIGLDLFVRQSDLQRQNIAANTARLGTAIIALIAGLAFALIILDSTNKQAALRGRDLEQSAARMNTIIETAIDGVIVTDETSRIAEFSPAAEDMFGIKAKDATGQRLSKFIDLVGDAASTADAQHTIDASVIDKGRLKRSATRADGETFPVEVAFQRAATADGNIYIAFVRDISHRVAAETELVSARDAALANEQIKTDFLATMSHEIRTPLNGLLGNMDLLRDTALNPAQARYVKNMETSGRMLMRHVSDVLDITQYDAGKMSITSTLIHLPTLIEDIIATQTSLAQAQHTTLNWEWDGPPQDWIKSDPDRVQHILMNLVGNAVKFTKDGRVTITLRKYDDERQPRLLISIEDTGPGMSANLVPRIFEDFVTGATTYDRDVGGTGLGLSIAKRFATGLGGHVGVESLLGKGSTFWVDLPITIARSPELPAGRKTLPPVAVQKILVIEDNSINRIVVREMLEADGHFVTDASNGADGVALAHKQKFDLILMDIRMPVMDGREAAQQIMTGGGASAKSPIVALTANVMSEDQAGFLAAGMIATLTKPLSRMALRALLREMNAPPATSDNQLVDIAHFGETKSALSNDAFHKVKDRFLTEANAFMIWFEDDIFTPLPEIAERAHKLAGATALFGLVHFKSALLDLENAARAEDRSLVVKLHETLPLLWQLTKDALEKANDTYAQASS